LCLFIHSRLFGTPSLYSSDHPTKMKSKGWKVRHLKGSIGEMIPLGPTKQKKDVGMVYPVRTHPWINPRNRAKVGRGGATRRVGRIEGKLIVA
jgi:hypothetical protein